MFQLIAYLLMFCCVFTSHAQRGWTPLISAALNGYADCVHLLLNAGADTNAKTGVRVDSCIWSGFAAVHLLSASLLEWCFECIGWYSISVEAPFSRLIFCLWMLQFCRGACDYVGGDGDTL